MDEGKSAVDDVVEEIVRSSRNLVMSKKDIKEWKSNYKSLPILTDYFVNLYMSEEELEDPALRHKEHENMTSLAKLLMDAIQTGDVGQGKLYRWNLMSQPMSFWLQQDEWNSLLHSMKMTMQLRVANNWVNWIYISTSETMVGADGVFAARNFRKNCIVGFYSGALVWDTNVQGGDEPSDAELEAAEVTMTDYCVFVRSNDCRLLLVDPTYGPKLLRMGIHYVKETKDVSKRNVKYIEDGSLQCTSDILCETELLLLSKDVVESESEPEPESKSEPKRATQIPRDSVATTRKRTKRGRPKKRILKITKK